MMELFQTEWCPSSRRVRQRLTELGVDYVVRQVPVVKSARRTLMDASGSDSIPALVLDDGLVVGAYVTREDPRDALIGAGREAVLVWGRDGTAPRSYGGGEIILDSCLAGADATQLSEVLDAIVRIDTPDEAEYYRHGGILKYVLRQLKK